MHLLSVLANLAVLTTATPFLTSRGSAQVCNGQAAFCNRKYSNVSLVGTHDAPFVGPIVDPVYNQEKTVAQQLSAGIRFMTGQVHEVNSTLHMCHTSCDLEDAGPLSTFLTTVKTFLDSNPNEVVTILLANGDYKPVTMFGQVFSSIPGLINYAFVPSTSPNKLPMSSWPTYGQLISAGKRLVVFMDYDANESQVPYILDEFTYFFETPYDTTDPSFPECTINRPPNTTSAAGRMYLVNHFLDKELIPGNSGILIPDNARDYQTNAATGNGSIGAQAHLCQSLYGRPPNVVVVDMFDRGNVFTAQDNLNGL